MNSLPTEADLRRARQLARLAPPLSAAGVANLRRLIGAPLIRHARTGKTKATNRAA